MARSALKPAPQPPPETVGDRLFLIRLACGDGRRNPESAELFAARVERATGEHYDPATISRLERMLQRWKLGDVETFARVDPLKRGREWLAFGNVETRPHPPLRPSD